MHLIISSNSDFRVHHHAISITHSHSFQQAENPNIWLVQRRVRKKASPQVVEMASLCFAERNHC